MEDIQEVKNRLKDFEIPVSERLTKLKLIQKLIENTNEDNLNENIKAICKMLTDVKKIYYFNVSDLNKWDFKKILWSGNFKVVRDRHDFKNLVKYFLYID